MVGPGYRRRPAHRPNRSGGSHPRQGRQSLQPRGPGPCGPGWAL